MRRRGIWLALVLILLLAAGLRFYRITGQSLWNDEGTSAALALRDLATISRDAGHDIHPPMYYWLLHVWVKVWGSGELALRSLSALLGVVLVGLVFGIGESLFSAEVGLLAAFFSAISPFQVYYSQETRMYMLLAALGALGTYALVRLLRAEQEERPMAGWAVAYGLAVVLGLYTHYSFPLLLGIWNLAYLALWLRRRGGARPLLRWIALQAASVALYLPWLPTGVRQMGQWPAISEPHSLTFFALDAFRLFLGGHTLDLSRSDWLILVASLGIAALVGILPSKRERNALPWWVRTGLVALWAGLPVAAQWVLSLWRPAYRPKFFLVSAPAFALLLARGALWPATSRARRGFGRIWSQAWLLLVCLVVAGVGTQALNNYYYNPAYARDNYRGIAQYVEAFGEQGDAVLINAPSQAETFAYYYKGSLPVYPLPKQRPLDKAATQSQLQAMLEGTRRVFAVYWATDESDPDRFIETWMDAHAFKASDDWFGNVRFVVYAVPQEPLAEIAHAMDVLFGEAIQLEGYTLLSEDVSSGGIVQLTLFWRALADIPERYKVFVHLLDGGGHVVGQRDAEPGGGLRLTTTWQPGEQIADNYGVPVPPGTPPGEYLLEVGMYHLQGGARLPISQNGALLGDHLLLKPIRVGKAARQPSLSAIPVQKRLSARLGPLELGGVDVHKLGFEGQDVALKPGDVLHLTLFWRAAEAPGVDYVIVIGDQGTAVLNEGQPAEGRYPTSLWSAGEVVRDDRYLLLPADLQPGRLELNIALRALPNGEWSEAVPLCEIEVVR